MALQPQLLALILLVVVEPTYEQREWSEWRDIHEESESYEQRDSYEQMVNYEQMDSYAQSDSYDQSDSYEQMESYDQSDSYEKTECTGFGQKQWGDLLQEWCHCQHCTVFYHHGFHYFGITENNPSFGHP